MTNLLNEQLKPGKSGTYAEEIARASTISNADFELLKIGEVAALLRITRQAIWQMRKKGDFPEPIMALSSKQPRWIKSEILDWIEERKLARDRQVAKDRAAAAAL
jgi:predicted DNA-binding transcriptional regulator AlpA